MSWNGTVYCSYCHNKGHNKRSCPTLKEYVERHPDSYAARAYQRDKEAGSKRSCGFCCETGHNRKTCPESKKEYSETLGLNVAFRERVAEYLKEEGLAVGALVTVNNGWQTNNEDRLMMVTHIDWDEITFDGISDNWRAQCIVAQELSDMGGDIPMTRGHKVRIALEELFEGYDGNMRQGPGVISCVNSPVPPELAEQQIPDNFVHSEVAIKEMWKKTSKWDKFEHERNVARNVMQINPNDSENL